MTLRRAVGTAFVQEDSPEVVGAELEQVVADPATWPWMPDGGPNVSAFSLRVTEAGGRRWETAAYAPHAPPTTHQLDLSENEARFRVCAMELSGWLPGPFGILSDLPPGLAGEELRAYVAEDLAPPAPWARSRRY
ncbi:hypothetical protein [Streptomyces crystallinus]|uniref:hypothetical protein n=1 Tax=Streptomyces crystallinus TaxID=68191 RepID=UPI0031DF4E04